MAIEFCLRCLIFEIHAASVLVDILSFFFIYLCVCGLDFANKHPSDCIYGAVDFSSASEIQKVFCILGNCSKIHGPWDEAKVSSVSIESQFEISRGQLKSWSQSEHILAASPCFAKEE